MPYDFHQLSPHDLEILVRDLLQAEWGVTLESFKAGRDGGVDLRYARGPHNLVVQVKHYVKTGLPGLLRDLKAEAAKVVTLKPTRYLLATSVPLSPANKQAITEIFGGALAVADVLGQEDLNNLLGRHGDIEQKHYKLWLASRAVLDRVLNSEVLTQTEFQVEKVHATIRRNVRSAAFPKALEILDRDRVVIISGAPGVGKTTLANMLLYRHMEVGWERPSSSAMISPKVRSSSSAAARRSSISTTSWARPSWATARPGYCATRIAPSRTLSIWSARRRTPASS